MTTEDDGMVVRAPAVEGELPVLGSVHAREVDACRAELAAVKERLARAREFVAHNEGVARSLERQIRRLRDEAGDVVRCRDCGESVELERIPVHEWQDANAWCAACHGAEVARLADY